MKLSFTVSHKIKHPKGGFTLMEVMITIAIIIVLVVGLMSIMKLNTFQSTEQATENKLNVLKQQIDAHYLKYGQYPSYIETENTNHNAS